MSETFVGSVGGKIADQFLVQLYTPAYLFWLGGAALYARANWDWLEPLLKALPEPYIIVLAGAWLLLVTASAAIGQRFEPLIIRVLEGYYWPPALARWATRRYRRRFKKLDAAFQSLMPRIVERTATARERERFAEIDAGQHRLPAREADLMPTRLGNVMRAAERRIDAKYGLDPSICWSRLWTVISKDSRDDVSSARSVLDIGARSFLWGACFAAWTPLSWWAAPAAVATALGSYWWMVSAAGDYAELLESAFDTYRFALYAALKLSIPIDSDEEPRRGRTLTQYLWRGDVPIVFTHDAQP